MLGSPERARSACRREANVAVYRDQMRELEGDLRNGIVSKDQYQQDRDELERRLLDDALPGPAESKKVKAPLAGRKVHRGPPHREAVSRFLLRLRHGAPGHGRRSPEAVEGDGESCPGDSKSVYRLIPCFFREFPALGSKFRRFHDGSNAFQKRREMCFKFKSTYIKD